MVDLTPPAGVDTSLTVYDRNQRVQAGNILYDLLHQTRTNILECSGLLEAIALRVKLEGDPAQQILKLVKPLSYSRSRLRNRMTNCQ
jgi:hypothetical protein